jgi:hypothetical protein
MACGKTAALKQSKEVHTMNPKTYSNNNTAFIQFNLDFLKEVEEFGYVLGSFTTKAFMFNATEDHEVWVYELDKRKFWIRKFDGELMEFREIT